MNAKNNIVNIIEIGLSPPNWPSTRFKLSKIAVEIMFITPDDYYIN